MFVFFASKRIQRGILELNKYLLFLIQAQLAMGSIKEVIQSEQRAMNESTYTVSSVLNSSNLITTSRSESLKELLDGGGKYRVYRFNIRY